MDQILWAYKRYPQFNTEFDERPKSEYEQAEERRERQAAWQRARAANKELLSSRTAITLGKPRAQPLVNVIGKRRSQELQRLLHSHDMYFVELFCSFHSLQGAVRTVRAEFNATFRCEEGFDPPLVHDLDPREINTEIKVARKVTLDPTARFSEIELGVGGLDFAIEYTQLKPVIRGGGYGEATVFWDYRANKAQELGGGKRMYVIVYAPKDAPTGYVNCDMKAQVKYKRWRYWEKLGLEDPGLLDIRLW